jgi:hypothetical protein
MPRYRQSRATSRPLELVCQGILTIERIKKGGKKMPVELIWIIISTVILVRFWKAVALLALCTLVCLTILGLVEAAAYLSH